MSITGFHLLLAPYCAIVAIQHNVPEPRLRKRSNEKPVASGQQTNRSAYTPTDCARRSASIYSFFFFARLKPGFCPLSFALCPLSFVLCPLSFVLCPLSLVLYHPSRESRSS